ncbi:MAG: alpha/beta hydrolase [Panacagrimonas sp.]|jgi:acetyl esterase/lipase|nr:alpha/beta hydrolase [Panacagrimonas sp.]MCC2656107.1 alpha/beta hydrolase [Panacagrimonas sp.]
MSDPSSPIARPRPRPFPRAVTLGAWIAAGAAVCAIAWTGAALAFGASPSHTLQRDVTYTPAQWPQAQRGDLYLPGGAGPFPAVVVVHGGGWNSRDRQDMVGISQLLAENGFVAFNIDYRLAPQFHHPAPVEDVRAAVSYLREHARSLKIDPAHIGGWGYSAGAHLVTLAANSDRGAVPLMQAVVAGGMPADFRRYPQSPIIHEYIGASYTDAKAAWEAASPYLQVSPDDPPMFIYHGNGDLIVQPEELTAMQAALQRNGVEVEVRQVPILGHIAVFYFSEASRRDAIAFLKRKLKPPG